MCSNMGTILSSMLNTFYEDLCGHSKTTYVFVLTLSNFCILSMISRLEMIYSCYPKETIQDMMQGKKLSLELDMPTIGPHTL